MLNELGRQFRPEFLNRLDEIILFKPLTKENIRHIVDLLLDNLNQRLKDREIQVKLTEEAKQYITDHGYDPVYGARPLRRYLQKYVETLAAKIILGGKIHMGDVILIEVRNNELTAMLESQTE